MGGSKGGGGGSVQTPRETSYLQDKVLPNLGWYESQFMSTPYDIGNYYNTIATGGAVNQAAGQGSSRWGVGGNQTQTFAGGAVAGGQGTGGDSALNLIESNPILKGLWDNIQKEQQSAGTLQGMMDTNATTTKQLGTEVNQLLGAPDQLKAAEAWYAQQQAGLAPAEQFLSQQEAGLGSAMKGTLLPGQQAMIDSQVGSSQTQLKNQLANLGLGSSTQGTMLGGEIGLQGAATGGQLMQQNIAEAQQNVQLGLGGVQSAQGNIGLGLQGISSAQQGVNLLNAAQQLSLGSQQLGAQEQNQLFQQFGSVASQFSAFQGQMASESSQAYQMSTTFLNNVLQPLGYALQAGQQTIAADSVGKGGGGGGGGGSPMSGISGLIGGLGSLFGGGGAAAGIGGLSSVGGLGAGAGVMGTSVAAGGGIMGALGGVGSAVGSILALFT
jgi:hypothetical protein